METRPLILRQPHLLVAGASGLLTLLGTRSGIGISWDSTDYIAVGLSMAEGRGALDVTGQPMVIRPPGLSALVTLGDWLSLSPDTALRIVNAIAMVFIVWGTHQLLGRVAVRQAAKWIGVVLVALGPALFDVFTMAWSEPPFIALVLCCLLIATRERTWPWEFLLIGAFSALFFVRYVGPFFAAPLALIAAIVQSRSSGFVLAFLRSVSVLATSLVLPWLWLMRNKDLSGYLTGYREPGGGSLFEPLKTFTGTLGSWVIGRAPLDGNGGIYLNWNDHSVYMQGAGILLWLAISALSLGFFLSTSRTRNQNIIVSACIGLIVFYGAFSVYRFVYAEMGPLDSRMMIGLYVPIVITLVVCADHISRSLPGNAARVSTKTIVALSLVVIAWHGVTTSSNLTDYGSNGRYWGTEFHRTVPIHQFAANLPKDVALYSNEPQSLFAATFHWPIRNQYQWDRPLLVPCSRRYFVWFNQSFLPDGKPMGADVVYEDSWGQVLDLGECSDDIARYWP